MKTLAIDIETFSDLSLPDVGVYKYVDSQNFEVLLFAYAFDDSPVEIVDIASGEKIPKHIQKAIYDKSVIKAAFNAQFERVCLSKHFGKPIEAESWHCTMVKAATLGIAGNLDSVSKSLGFPLDKQKLFTGKNLIRLFSIPRKSTKADPQQVSFLDNKVRLLPSDKPEEWQQFKDYCIQDVVVEREIRKKLESFPITEDEMKMWYLDQKINDYGVRLDMDFVLQAIGIDQQYTQKLINRYKEVTGLDNPKSVTELKKWLSPKLGFEVKSITKESMPELLKASQGLPEVTEALEIRKEIAKTSVSKYTKMEEVICSDMRARGLLQYYGASRTGRWTGRLIQVQNLPQNKIKDLGVARDVVKDGDLDLLEMCYPSVPVVLSQLIRTAFIPTEGHRFMVSDFSAIEARVIAWLSGEAWRIEVFKTHGKIYEASAAQMFRVPIESIDKGSPLRQKGKVAELACIAQGQLVLTDKGLVPIEEVTLSHKVWDGEEFTSHDGVIFKGVREVITYEGLTATKDHLVWVEGKSWPIRFGEASSSGSRLLQSGTGRKAIRISKDYNQREKMEKRLEGSLCVSRMYKLWKSTMGTLLQSSKRKIKRLSTLLATKANTKMVGSKIYGSKAKMHEPQGWEFRKLWSKRYRIPFQISSRSRTLDDRELRASRSRNGIGQDRCKWSLRTRKFKMGNSSGELSKSAKVYDILNCGKNNRFTVSNVLVHNCGYGGSIGALKNMDRKWAESVSEEELHNLITSWRESNKKIVQFWWDVEAAAKKAVEERTIVELQHGLKFIYKPGILFIQLPSGRRLAYIRPKVEDHEQFSGKTKLTYEGMDQNYNWTREDTYGGKLVENIVQATARDCLREAMLRLDEAGYKIAFHVHDEVILDVPIGEGSLDEIAEIMGKTIPWAEGLPLTADGFECHYYQKD